MQSAGLQIIAPGLIEQTWNEAEVLGGKHHQIWKINTDKIKHGSASFSVNDAVGDAHPAGLQGCKK